MDHEVGRLLGALDALGSSVRDTTAVVLHADHVRSTFDFSLPHGSDKSCCRRDGSWVSMVHGASAPTGSWTRGSLSSSAPRGLSRAWGRRPWRSRNSWISTRLSSRSQACPPCRKKRASRACRSCPSCATPTTRRASRKRRSASTPAVRATTKAFSTSTRTTRTPRCGSAWERGRPTSRSWGSRSGRKTGG